MRNVGRRESAPALRGAKRFAALAVACVLAVVACATPAEPTPTQVPSRAPPASQPATTRMPSGSGPLQVSASPGCRASETTATITTDRADYRAGDAIVFSVKVTNDGAAACELPTGNCLPQIQVTDASGALIWDRAAIAVVCEFGPPVSLVPRATSEETVVWNGRVCAGRTPESCPDRPAAAGVYVASANWNGGRASTSFSVAS